MDQTVATGSLSIAGRIEIDAAPMRVWQALTEPVELARWFALEADCRPGTGGSLRLSWGEPSVMCWNIAAWEPAAGLLAVEVPVSADGPHGTLPRSDGLSRRTLEFRLAGGATRTVLSWTHAGFTADTDPAVLAVVRRGWEFELHSLRHYLAHHAGTPRDVAWVRRASRRPVADIWQTLARTFATAGPDAHRRPGEPFALRGPHGDGLTGAVVIYDPPYQLVATLAQYRDALFRIKLAEQADQTVEINLWLSAWGLDRQCLTQFERYCDEWLDAPRMQVPLHDSRRHNRHLVATSCPSPSRSGG